MSNSVLELTPVQMVACCAPLQREPMSLERAAVLAPVIVVAFGAAAAVVVLWAKVGWESLRRHRRPWLVVGIAMAAIALIAVLSLIGVNLPRE